ncbi:type I restriction enzyme, S subunit [Gammaproteobacteria bacterium]
MIQKSGRGRGMAAKLLETTVGEVCKIFDGPHATPTRIDSGPIFLGITSLNKGRIDLSTSDHVSEEDFVKWTRRVIPQPDDVVFSYETKLGEAAIIPKGLRCCLGRRMGLMRPDSKKIDSRFLLYYYLGPEFQDVIRERTIHGSTVERIALIEFPTFPLRIPPLPIQKAIAHILGTLDDKIELNRRMNATLEEMARAIFKSWFVDFDPVRAKMDGRVPFGMDEETAALFPDGFQDSELGQIPRGWRVTTLGACIGFRSGFSFKSQDWQDSGVPVVKIGSVKPGIIDLTQVSYVSEEIAQQAARYRLSTGDMLIGMTGYVGEVGLVPPSNNPPLLNQRVGKFVMATPGTASLAFWYCTTRQPEFKTFVETHSHGTAQANVSGESIMEFPLVVPHSAILDGFNRNCQPLLNRILANHGESHTLAALRDTLLPKLLSGELSVAAMESKMGTNV